MCSHVAYFFFYFLYRLRKSEPLDLYAYYNMFSGIVGEKNNKYYELRSFWGKSILADKNGKLKINDLFKMLTENECRELERALRFFIEKAPYSVPGYFLMEKIHRKLNYEGSDAFVFKHGSIYRVLSDRYIYKNFYAIKNKYRINVTLNNKDPFNVFPLMIRYEYYLNRAYLFCENCDTCSLCCFG